MSLRVRQIGRQWVQTLKTASESSGAIGRRGEWETRAPVVSGQGRLDVARLSESPLPALLAKQRTPARLEPVFSTRVRRALWNVERSDGAIEVALDVGEISAEREGRSLQEPICEVELELKRGDPPALIELALELLKADGKTVAGANARGVAARPSAAITSCRNSLHQQSRPLRKGSSKNLTKRSTTASALRAVIAHGLAVLTANIELLLSYDDPEYVHQSRVALRRVRSAIRLFDREERDVPRWLSDELRWFARALGEARDWDVIAGETLPSLTDAIGADAVKLLVAKADVKRRQARANIRKAARSSRYAALVLNGEGWCMTPVPAGAALLVDAAAPASKSCVEETIQACAFFCGAVGAAAASKCESLRSACAMRLICSPLCCPSRRPSATSKRWPNCRTCWDS